MTNRRTFVKSTLIAGVSASLAPLAGRASVPEERKAERKHWVWINPDPKEDTAELEKRYDEYRRAGIRGIFFEADSEKHFRAARSRKLEAHRWMWTTNRGEKSLLESHPEWYAVNRLGESCADKPPYVNYYRWLCPSRPEVREYLKNDVRNILSKDYVDGIHLDYVRFCDVILPVNLWENYKIEQTRELPQYDYCYCEVCRSRFKEWRGKDLDDIEFPEADLSWRLFRYRAITSLVNELSSVAAASKKPITAAVFPTPEVARRNVRQDWLNWNLDGICPMIYHGFYKEPVAWIGDAVAEGVKGLQGRFPLYAGIYLPDFKDAAEVQQGMEHALRNGARGISLFGKVNNEVLQALQKASANIK